MYEVPLSLYEDCKEFMGGNKYLVPFEGCDVEVYKHLGKRVSIYCEVTSGLILTDSGLFPPQSLQETISSQELLRGNICRITDKFKSLEVIKSAYGLPESLTLNCPLVVISTNNGITLQIRGTKKSFAFRI